MEDNFGDGMCCSRGFGGYEYYIGGTRIYSTNLLHTFTDYVEHTFTVEDEYTPTPTISPTIEPMMEVQCLANPQVCGCDNLNQEDYRGTISVTEDGIECQAWNAMSPHVHEDTPDAYPYHDLSENYCRSPTGGIPWCYTTDPNVEWGYCRVPSCPMEEQWSEVQTTDTPTTSEGSSSAIPTLAPVTQAPVTAEPSGSPTVSSYNQYLDKKSIENCSCYLLLNFPFLLHRLNHFISVNTHLRTNTTTHSSTHSWSVRLQPYQWMLRRRCQSKNRSPCR
jgi:hypothetical protein